MSHRMPVGTLVSYDDFSGTLHRIDTLTNSFRCPISIISLIKASWSYVFMAKVFQFFKLLLMLLVLYESSNLSYRFSPKNLSSRRFLSFSLSSIHFTPKNTYFSCESRPYSTNSTITHNFLSGQTNQKVFQFKATLFSLFLSENSWIKVDKSWIGFLLSICVYNAGML